MTLLYCSYSREERVYKSSVSYSTGSVLQLFLFALRRSPTSLLFLIGVTQVSQKSVPRTPLTPDAQLFRKTARQTNVCFGKTGDTRSKRGAGRARHQTGSRFASDRGCKILQSFHLNIFVVLLIKNKSGEAICAPADSQTH
jgi:hypothetical protein